MPGRPVEPGHRLRRRLTAVQEISDPLDLAGQFRETLGGDGWRQQFRAKVHPRILPNVTDFLYEACVRETGDFAVDAA
ncbi:hypothetical protein GCM10023085_58050 [Actinomadura viridis]